jgi:tellurite resistance protein
MARVDEYLDRINDPRLPALTPDNPADAVLLALLAHVAFADGEVADTEVEFLARVLPGRDRDALRQWAVTMGGRPFDYRVVARVLPTEDERWKGLRFAARMAWKDGVLETEERTVLERLSSALELSAGAVDRVLHELAGAGRAEIDGDLIVGTFQKMGWDSVDWGEGGVQADWAVVVPEGATGVLRIGLDGVEVLGFYREGVAAQFLEGAAFVRWRDVIAYTKAPTLGAAVKLHTEDGRGWTLTDFRLSGLGRMLDRLYGEGRGRPDAADLQVTRLQGD